jgi:hypothetical protein
LSIVIVASNVAQATTQGNTKKGGAVITNHAPKDAPTTISVNSSTDIKVNAKKATLKDITKDMKVNVRSQKDKTTGALLAVSIQAKEVKAKQALTKSAPTKFINKKIIKVNN